MLIKFQALASALRKKTQAIYVLIGQDHYLLNDAALSIKKTWNEHGQSDDKILYLNTAADWALLMEEANSYSLFARHVLLDTRYDKKNIDNVGKTILQAYLKNINSCCLIILRAPNIPAKQLQWLTNHEQVTVVQAVPLTSTGLQHWITTQLQSRSIRHDPTIPRLIHQYTQGNMLACAQVIEKIALISHEHDVLTAQGVMEQLTDQCEYQLYELADACLTANPEKAIHLLRQACHARTEPTLILWLLTQEIRQLIQLSYLLAQCMSLTAACNQLKIWPQRAKLYEVTLKRVPRMKLHLLLQMGQQLDEHIKSNQNNHIWHALESLALGLC